MMRRRRLKQAGAVAAKGGLSAKSMIKAKSIAASILNMSENDLADIMDTDQVRLVVPMVNILYKCQVGNPYRVNINVRNSRRTYHWSSAASNWKHPKVFLSARTNCVIAQREAFHQYQHLASSVFPVNLNSMWCIQERQLFARPLGTGGVDERRWAEIKRKRKPQSGVLGSFNLYLTPFSLSAKCCVYPGLFLSSTG